MSRRLSTQSQVPVPQATTPATAPEHPAEIEVRSGTSRRTYSVAYKLKMIEEAETQRRNGTLSSWLRRQGLYSSHLSKWEAQQREGLLDPENPVKRGAPPDPETPLRHELENTLRQLARAEKELAQAREIISIQKKLCTLFGLEPHPSSEKA